MPTQREIAEALQLSQATVSMALRGHPRISKAIREKVRHYADQSGYRPDPTLSALAAYRTGKRSPGHRGTVAWLTNFSTKEGWRVDAFGDYFDGARQFLEQQGYKLETFWMREPGMHFKRLKEILFHRGVECLLLCPQEFSGSRFDWDFSEFSVVTLGYSLEEPQFHLVTAQGLTSMQTLCGAIHRKGLRKIGFVYSDEIEKRARGSWLGGYLVACNQLPEIEPIPALALSDFDQTRLNEWLKTHQPQAVISTHRSILEQIETSLTTTQKMPQLFLTATSPNTGYSGMCFDNKNIGMIAARKVISLHHAHIKGVPSAREFTSIEGRLIETTHALTAQA